MKIPFTKAHGARNDFLLTWTKEAPSEDLSGIAQAICDRHTGVGADGWLLVSLPDDASGAGFDATIRLFNADGGEVEMSGNGTRCAAAFLIEAGFSRPEMTILTGGGPKQLRLLGRQGAHFDFEMNMGKPVCRAKDLRTTLTVAAGVQDVTILNVGNPQCAVFVDDFSLDWRGIGAEIERHPRFPQRTNVSFVRPVDDHTIDVRFFERGVGETMSSGTGSTGAMASAVMRGVAKSPVRVLTPAGPLDLRWEGEEIFLAGPAELIASGHFFYFK